MKDMELIDMIIQFGKGTTCAKGVDSITLTTTVYTITVTDILWVPELVANLLSTEQLREKGLFYRNDKQVLFAKGTRSLLMSTVMMVCYIQGLRHAVTATQTQILKIILPWLLLRYWQRLESVRSCGTCVRVMCKVRTSLRPLKTQLA